MQGRVNLHLQERFAAAEYHRFRKLAALRTLISIHAEKAETVNAAHSPAQVSYLVYGAFARPRC